MSLIKIENNKLSNPSDVSYKDIHPIEYFLMNKRSVHTMKKYRHSIIEFFNVNTVYEITYEDIVNVSIFNVEEWKLRLENKGMAASTIHNKISALSSLYDWFIRYGHANNKNKKIIQYNPFNAIRDELPTLQYTETEFMTEEQLKLFLSAIDISTTTGLRDKLLFSLFLTTGMRKSELINVKLSDITKIGEFNVIRILGKGNKKDFVKLQITVKELLELYLLKTNRTYEKNSNDYLFISHSTNGLKGSGHLNPSSVNKILKKYCEKYKIPQHLKVHSLRHSAITIVAEKMGLRKAQEFARHVNSQTTDRYVHSINKLKEYGGDNIDIL